MPSKFIAYCPTCLDRNLSDTDAPCAGCGFPPFWPGNQPNMYRNDPTVVLQAVKPPEAEESFDELEELLKATTAASTVGVPIIVVDEATQPEPAGEELGTDNDDAVSGALEDEEFLD